jgi:acyl-CoA thioesterase-1
MALAPPPDLLRRRLVLGSFASVLTLTSACSPSAKPSGQTLSADATLLCLGDSLTYGFGAVPEASYPRQLAQLTGHATQNAGLNGDTTEGALARLPDLLQNNSPGLVLVSIGGNDFLRKLPLERTRLALKQILLSAANQAQVVLIAEPQPSLLSAATGSLTDHPLYAEVAKETGTALFENGWSEVLSRAELRSDQIHANAKGYAIFAERLTVWLQEMKFLA